MPGLPPIEADHSFGFHFHTNRAVTADAFGNFLVELTGLAQSHAHFGPAARVEVTGLGTGSVWGHITISVAEQVAAGVLTAGVIVLAGAVAERIRTKTGDLGKAAHDLIKQNDIVAVTISTRDLRYVIEKRELEEANLPTGTIGEPDGATFIAMAEAEEHAGAIPWQSTADLIRQRREVGPYRGFHVMGPSVDKAVTMAMSGFFGPLSDICIRVRGSGQEWCGDQIMAIAADPKRPSNN